jgi:hypothetical protein
MADLLALQRHVLSPARRRATAGSLLAAINLATAVVPFGRTLATTTTPSYASAPTPTQTPDASARIRVDPASLTLPCAGTFEVRISNAGRGVAGRRRTHHPRHLCPERRLPVAPAHRHRQRRRQPAAPLPHLPRPAVCHADAYPDTTYRAGRRISRQRHQHDICAAVLLPGRIRGPRDHHVLLGLDTQHRR